MMSGMAKLRAQRDDARDRLAMAQAALQQLREHHLATDHIPDGPGDCFKCEVIDKGLGEEP